MEEIVGVKANVYGNRREESKGKQPIIHQSTTTSSKPRIEIQNIKSKPIKTKHISSEKKKEFLSCNNLTMRNNNDSDSSDEVIIVKNIDQNEELEEKKSKNQIINISQMRNMEEKNKQLKTLAKQNTELLSLLEEEENRGKEMQINIDQLNGINKALIYNNQLEREKEQIYISELLEKNNEFQLNLNMKEEEISTYKNDVESKERRAISINSENNDLNSKINHLIKVLEAKDEYCKSIHEEKIKNLQAELLNKSQQEKEKDVIIAEQSTDSLSKIEYIQILEDKLSMNDHQSQIYETKISHLENELKKLKQIYNKSKMLQKPSPVVEVSNSVIQGGEEGKNFEALYKKEQLLKSREQRTRRELEQRFNSLNGKVQALSKELDVSEKGKVELREDAKRLEKLNASALSRVNGLEYKLQKALQDLKIFTEIDATQRKKEVKKGKRKLFLQENMTEGNRFSVDYRNNTLTNTEGKQGAAYIYTTLDGDEEAVSLLENLKINEWLRLLLRQPSSQLTVLIADKMTELLTYILGLSSRDKSNRRRSVMEEKVPEMRNPSLSMQKKIMTAEIKRKQAAVKYFSLLIDFVVSSEQKVLNLNDREVTDMDLEDLTSSLLMNDQVSEIHLCENQFESILCLCSLLSVTKTIKYVDLRNNCIDQKEVKLLVENISRNPRVTHVYISSEGKIEALGTADLNDEINVISNEKDNEERMNNSKLLTTLLKSTVIMTIDLRSVHYKDEKNSKSPSPATLNIILDESSKTPFQPQETSPLANRIKALEKRLANESQIDESIDFRNDGKEEVKEVTSFSPLTMKISMLEKQFENNIFINGNNNKVKKKRPRSAIR